MNIKAIKHVCRSAASSGAIMIALIAGPAFAQGASEAPQSADSASAQADSEPTAGDIIVTAQFRNQRLQDTPLAISAINAELLAARGQGSVSELGQSAPNVSITPSAGIRGGSQVFIRGIGQSDFNFALEPGVGVYIDDIYFGTVAGSQFDMLDVDRVEILRGPQGTLAGKNSIGGALKLFSKRPTGDGSGYAEAGYGTDNNVVLRGAFDIALVPERLFMRVSGALNRQDGYVDRLDFKCANPSAAVSGTLPQTNRVVGDCKLGTLGGRDAKSLRVALRWLPTDNVEVNVIGDYLNDSSEAGAEVLAAVGTIPALYQAQVQAQYGVQLDSRFIGGRYVSYATYQDPSRGIALNPVNSNKGWGVTGTIDWKLAEGLSLKSITGYRKFEQEFVGDQDGSPLNQNMQDYILRHHQFSQELRLSGSAFNKMLDWTIGGYYYDALSRQLGFVDLQSVIIPVPGLRPGLFFNLNDPVETKSKAAFATGILHLSDRLNITAGYRLSGDSKVYTFFRQDPLPNSVVNFLGLNNLGRSPKASLSRSDYRVTVDYRWSPELLTYATFSTGYKAGGINPRPNTPAQVVPFGPESVENYEAGFKADLFDRRLRFNMAGFIAKYKDLQLQALSADANGVLALITTNVGKATIKGIEGEIEAHPVDGLSIDGSASYLDFRYNDLGSAAGVAGAPCLSCQPQNSPKWKWSLGAQYEIPIGGGDISLTPRIDANYQSRVFFQATNRPSSSTPPRTIFNARLTLKVPDPNWQVSLAVLNLADKYYYYNYTDVLDAVGTLTASPARGRSYLLTVRKTFN